MRDSATCPACGNWWTLAHVASASELDLTCDCGETARLVSDQVGAARHALDVSTRLPGSPVEGLLHPEGT